MDLYDRLKPVFESYLRENNGSLTAERFIVLRAITMMPSDFTSYDLLCKLTKNNGDQEVSRASIHNIISLLEKAEIIEWIPLKSKGAHYRVCEDYLECV